MYNPYDVPLAQLFTADGKVRDDAKLLWDEDWLDEVTDNAALRQEYGASVSGGNEKTQYMFSLGYLNEDGVLKTTNFERYSGRLNVETQAKPWFAAGMGANFARNSTNSSQTSASATSNVFFSAQMMAPIRSTSAIPRRATICATRTAGSSSTTDLRVLRASRPTSTASPRSTTTNMRRPPIRFRLARIWISWASATTGARG